MARSFEVGDDQMSTRLVSVNAVFRERCNAMSSSLLDAVVAQMIKIRREVIDEDGCVLSDVTCTRHEGEVMKLG